MRVVSYYNVVPAVNKSQEKFDILTKFVQGVKAVGDQGILHYGNNIIDSDVAIIQGWQHQAGKNGTHLQLRQKIIDTQIAQTRYVCAADSNLFLYANQSNKPHHYLRYSFNGVFPDTGIYFDNCPNPKRWQQISQDTGIVLDDVRTNGKNILICLQRNGGWSMGTVDVVRWTVDVITEIRKYSDRPIIIRPHPGDKKAQKTYIPVLKQHTKNFKSVSVSNQNISLEVDLQNAWCVVNHNSSAVVGAIIKGYPAFITDPQHSQCAEVANTDFSLIENPKHFNRQRWLERISMFHWKFSELEDGSAWSHMRDYVRQ
jgi:hypothetical protein